MTVGDFGQHICEVGLRIDAVELGGLQDGDQGGGALPALITAGEQPVPAPEGNAADAIFGDVVVCFEPGVGGVYSDNYGCRLPSIMFAD